jgi:cellulose synthase operon protein C
MKKFSILYALLVCPVLLALLGVGCSRDPSVRKVKYLQSGQRYFDKGMYREAGIQFANAIQNDPNFAEAHYRQAQVYLKLQQWTLAYQELVRTVELQPENYSARLDLASLLIAGQRFKEAQEQTDVLLQDQANSPMVHSVVANLLAAQGNLPAAIQEIQKAVAVDPNRWESYVELAGLQVRAGQSEAAEPNLRKAVQLNPRGSTARLALTEYLQSQGRYSDAEQEAARAIDNDPNNPDPRATMVRIYMAQGKKDAAEQFLKQVRRDFPANPAGYTMLGDFYFSIGDLDHAFSEYGTLFREHPRDLHVKKNYVQILVLVNHLDEATKLDDEILKTSPRDLDALIDRGQVEIRQGKFQQAVETLQTAILNNSASGLAYFHLGNAFDRLGKLTEAENSWQNAVRLQPDLTEAQLALARLALTKGEMQVLGQASDRIIALRPASPTGYALRALSFIRQSQLVSAERDARQAIRLGPQSPEGYMEMGNLRLAQKNYEDAAGFYRQALDRDSNSVEGLSSLANALLAENKTDEALLAIQTQIAKQPQSSAFYDLLGTVQFDHRKNVQDLAAAESNLTKSIDLDKSNADARLKLGQVQAARGEIDQAIATTQAGIETNPAETSFYILGGRLYESKNDWNHAQEYYQRVLQIDPKNSQAANNLALALAQTGGNLDTALSLAQSARRGLPDSPNTADTLGWVFYKRGQYQSAVSSFLEALKLSARTKALDNPTFHFHLGLAYEKVGQPSLARQQLRQVLRISPNYSEAEDIRKLLGQLPG